MGLGPPAPLGYPNTRTLTPQELHGRRSSDGQQGAERRLAWQWLVAAAGVAPAMSYGILAAHEMQWSTMSQLARVVELLLQLPQQAPAARLCCHVLRSCLVGAALIACADKAEGTHGQW